MHACDTYLYVTCLLLGRAGGTLSLRYNCLVEHLNVVLTIVVYESGGRVGMSGLYLECLAPTLMACRHFGSRLPIQAPNLNKLDGAGGSNWK